VADNRYQGRILDDQEFEWLQADIGEFNKHLNEKSISLLESEGRERIEKSKAKKKEREEQRGGEGPLVEEDSVLAEAAEAELGDPGDESIVEDEEEEEEEEAGPDLLLRETARIVADMAELGADLDLLKSQFAQLEDKAREPADMP